MALEIERKFLINDDSWRTGVTESIDIRQGYLNSDKERTVRVRIAGEKGFLTIKGKSENLTRKEFEYDIPRDEALELLALCKKPIIEKVRHLYPADGLTWEIDVFRGENEGLVVAEVELSDPDQEVGLPLWIGKEVSGDPKYFNAALISQPFSTWAEAKKN